MGLRVSVKQDQIVLTQDIADYLIRAIETGVAQIARVCPLNIV